MEERTRTISRRSFLGGAAAFGVISVVTPSLAHAETAAEKQAEADAVKGRVINMQHELETASDNYYKALEEHEKATEAVNEAQGRIDDAQVKIKDLQSKLGTRARSMYRSGGASSFLDLLLGATTFEEFATNWGILNSMNENDADLVSQTKDLKAEIEEQKVILAEQEQVAADKENEAKNIKESTESTIAELEEIYSNLSAEAQQLLEQEQAAAAAAAAAAAEEARRQQAAASGGYSGGYSDNSSSGGGGYTGGYTSGGGAGIPSNGSVVDYALSRIGCPYVWGAEGPDAFDCSGLVTWCYRQIGMSVPHQSESQYAVAKAVMPVSSAAPGDVLWRYGHVGIAQVSGGTTYIHAPTFGAYVRNTDALSWAGFTASLRM